MRHLQYWMASVFAVAVLMGLFAQMTRRSMVFKSRSMHHYNLSRRYFVEGNELRRLYHSRMADRYFGYAARPFWFLPSDPPEPSTWADMPVEWRRGD